MPAPTQHSNIIGGSTASRVTNCPASVALVNSLPAETLARTTEYADEGTMLHAIISARIGEEAHDAGVLDGEQIDALDVCFNSWLELKQDVQEVALEVQAAFPGVPGAFGTCDLAARDEVNNVTYLRDWKFGRGVGVYAWYAVGDGAGHVRRRVNEQLLFYACCLRALWPDWFPDGVEVRLAIVQPRHPDGESAITEAVVGNADLDAFEAAVQAAVQAAESGASAHMEIGPWCRFAPCKAICPLHHAPLLDLSAIESLPAERGSAHIDKLRRVLAVAGLAEAIIAEARKQVHELLEAGIEVPDWKLVPKRGIRKWNQDDDATIRILRKRFKLRKDACLTEVLKSPAQIEKILPKGMKVPADLAGLVSSGTTLAPDDDPRPAAIAGFSSLEEMLSASLAISQSDA